MDDVKPMIVSDEWIVDEARSNYAIISDNDIGIDENPVISRADDGAWVQAWVWVRFPDKDDTKD